MDARGIGGLKLGDEGGFRGRSHPQREKFNGSNPRTSRKKRANNPLSFQTFGNGAEPRIYNGLFSFFQIKII